VAAAGQALAAGAVPAQVVALTEGVVKAMLLSKLKVCWAVGVVLAVAVSAGAGLTYRAAATEPRQASDRSQAARPVEDELEVLRLEVEALRKGLQATRERVKALEAEIGALRPRANASPVEGGKGVVTPGSAPKSAEVTWFLHPTQLENVFVTPGSAPPARPVQALEPPGGSAAQKNPPRTAVEGLVSKVDPSGLVSLTIGNHAGLSKGNTLEAMRLTTPPRYLGTLRILEVKPGEAVAQPVGRLTAPLRVGDRVANRIPASEPAANKSVQALSGTFTAYPSADPLADAEAAMRRLRQNPNDPEAIGAAKRGLEQALRDKSTRDFFANAEGALQQLRSNPGDPKAIERLRDTLKLLEQQQPARPTQPPGPRKP
jgi:hypothetical protein